MIPHIRDVETPAVGRYYRVPCVQQLKRGHLFWVPILGPPHRDIELGVPDEHWHYDLRFIGDRLHRRLFSQEPGSPYALGTVLARDAVADERADRQLRRLRCVRQMPEFPGRTYDGERCVKVLRLLEPQYRDVRLKPGCRTCPHRGLPLTGLPVDGEGRVVCPGHGLRWDLATGEMVPRCNPETTRA